MVLSTFNFLRYAYLPPKIKKIERRLQPSAALFMERHLCSWTSQECAWADLWSRPSGEQGPVDAAGGQREAASIDVKVSINWTLILTCGLAGGEWLPCCCCSNRPSAAEAMVKAVPLPKATCFTPRNTSRQLGWYQPVKLLLQGI